jgi:hypothetical protein
MTQEITSALVPNNPDLQVEERKTKDSTFNRVWNYFHDSKKQHILTDKERELADRWEKAWYILCSHRNKKETADLLQRIFHIKQSVAYDDVRRAMDLFNNPSDHIKEAKRLIAETMAMKGAKRAWKQGDMKSYLGFVKEYKDINNLNQESDSRLADLIKKQRPVVINFVTSREQLEAQASELIKDVPAIDTNYEDIEDEEESPEVS